MAPVVSRAVGHHLRGERGRNEECCSSPVVWREGNTRSFRCLRLADEPRIR